MQIAKPFVSELVGLNGGGKSSTNTATQNLLLLNGIDVQISEFFAMPETKDHVIKSKAAAKQDQFSNDLVDGSVGAVTGFYDARKGSDQSLLLDRGPASQLVFLEECKTKYIKDIDVISQAQEQIIKMINQNQNHIISILNISAETAFSRVLKRAKEMTYFDRKGLVILDGDGKLIYEPVQKLKQLYEYEQELNLGLYFGEHMSLDLDDNRKILIHPGKSNIDQVAIQYVEGLMKIGAIKSE